MLHQVQSESQSEGARDCIIRRKEKHVQVFNFFSESKTMISKNKSSRLVLINISLALFVAMSCSLYFSLTSHFFFFFLGYWQLRFQDISVGSGREGGECMWASGRGEKTCVWASGRGEGRLQEDYEWAVQCYAGPWLFWISKWATRHVSVFNEACNRKEEGKR